MAEDDIRLIPEVPGALAEAAQLGTLIPFVGAGVSHLAGCPNWGEFADDALRFLIGAGKFSYAQLAQLDGVNARVKLSLARSLQADHNLAIDFKGILHSHDWKNNARGQRIYAALSGIGKTFVTTNYDEWLDEEAVAPQPSISDAESSLATSPSNARIIFYQPQDITAANLNIPNAVFHLHGSLKNPEGMILTTREYLAHYANDRRKRPGDRENFILTFLEDLFSNKSVLFVGYGMQELEILEYIVLKTPRGSVELEPKHFILQGFYSHQRELKDFMERYYRECGIRLIPFLLDARGWDQLLEVLDDFAERLPAKQLAVLAELDEMGALLND